MRRFPLKTNATRRQQDRLKKKLPEANRLHKKAVAAAAESERKYQTLLDISPVGIFLTDPNGSCTYVNPCWCAIVGISSSEALGYRWLNYVHPDDQPELRKELEKAIKTGITTTQEYRFVHSTGTIAWVIGRAVQEKDAKGHVLGFTGTITDITARKKAEEMVIESERKYRKAETTGKIGHWDYNLDTHAVYVSDEIYRLYGIENGTTGRTPEDLYKTMAPEDKTSFDLAMQYALSGKGRADITYRITDEFGSIRYLHTLGELMINAETSSRHLIGTSQDVTLRINFQEEIIKEKKLSDSIINSLPGIFYLYTREGKILRWNRSLEEITSYSHEEIGGMHPLNFFDSRDQVLIADKIESVFITGETSVQTGLRLKDGQLIPHYFTGRRVMYQDQECLLGVGIDISERVAAQEKIREKSEELRQLAAHLHDIREEERAAMAREIHDELGQQLTSLKMDIYWLKDELAEEGKDYELKTEGILTLVDQTIKTVRDIAASLRPSLLDDVGLEEALRSYSADFQQRFAITVYFSSSLDEPDIPPKPSIGLFRIFQECLTNIARHAEASRVDIHISQVEHQIQLKVSDDGKGFAVDRAAEKKTLGLVGMKERVHMLGGKFRIESNKDKGTYVEITVPL